MSVIPSRTRHEPTARSVALDVLLECRSGYGFVQEILDGKLSRGSLAPADRRLSTQLAYGVLRRRGTLDALLRPLIRRPMGQVEPWLLEALRLGAFQLALLTHVPIHAAVHETVELAGGHHRPAAKGFLNGVLRALARLMTEELATGPAADALPLDAGRYRRLAQPVLPDPAQHPVEYLGIAFALPHWLARRWFARWPWQECICLGFWFAGPAPLWLRCNSLRIDPAAMLAALTKAGIAAEADENTSALRLAESMAIRDIPGYEHGWFTVQDRSAMKVAPALAPLPGSSVLDLCAAPGGKTTHLAELMNNQGRLLACDIDERRLQRLVELCGRLGITIVETCKLDPGGSQEPPVGPFDAALVDVPCSNTGVLGRRPEVRWRLKPDDMRHLVALQTRLLLQATQRIRRGGTVVYSTCSIEPEENGQVVQAVVKSVPDLVLEAEEEQVPGRPGDGGYWARLRRKEL